MNRQPGAQGSKYSTLSLISWMRALGRAFRIEDMQFLSLSRRRVDQFPPEAFTPALGAQEAGRVKALYATGLLRQLGEAGITFRDLETSQSSLEEIFVSLVRGAA